MECWELALKSLDTPSVLALSRQNLSPVRKSYDNENKSSLGAYEVYRSNEKIDLTIFASGSEVNLALEVSHKLATQNTYSKVISVPCQEIFFKQKNIYKNKILKETNINISIEAGRSDTWSKFIGENGMAFGIEDFGKSAPYKDIFKDFKLTASEIVNKTKNIINKN